MSTIEPLSLAFGTTLFGVIIRSSILFAACALVSLAFRSRSAETKHLIWRGALYGLLLLPVLDLALPPIHSVSHVLSRVDVSVFSAPLTAQSTHSTPPSVPPSVTLSTNSRHLPWTLMAMGVYTTVNILLLTRLALGVVRIKKLIRWSDPILDQDLQELAQEVWLQSLSSQKPSLRVSTGVSVPMTAGINQLFILLPVSWSLWPRDKLRAVLIHETAHARREDPATAFLASLAVCLFWMHPLVYWLRRQLATLSEEVCDEAVIHFIDPERYCRILIEFASDVTAGRSRLVAASGVAERSSIKKRLEWIFSSSQRSQTNHPLIRALLIAAFFPVLYLTAAARFNQPAATPYRISVANQEQAAKLESDLQQNPDNIEVQGALMAFYSNFGMQTEFTRHLLWMIAHHPEASDATMRFYGRRSLQPVQASLAEHTTALENYKRVKAAWEHALSAHPNSPEVLFHAGLCVEAEDPQRALALFRQARRMTSSKSPAQNEYLDAVAVIYATAVLADLKLGDLNEMGMHPNIAHSLHTEIETSTDPALLSQVGTRLAQFVSDQNIQIGLTLIQRAITLDPGNPKWAEALESAKAEPIRRRNLRNIVHKG